MFSLMKAFWDKTFLEPKFFIFSQIKKLGFITPLKRTDVII